MYADDVIVMSETAEELQSLLDVVNEYGRDFGVKFGKKIVTTNNDNESGKRQ